MTHYIAGCVVTDQAGAHFNSMIASGFWGDSEAEVLASLVYLGVQRALTDRLIPRVLTMEDVDEAPAPETFVGGRRVKTYKCEDCRDGENDQCVQTPDFKCIKCGTLTEIPF